MDIKTLYLLLAFTSAGMIVAIGCLGYLILEDEGEPVYEYAGTLMVTITNPMNLTDIYGIPCGIPYSLKIDGVLKVVNHTLGHNENYTWAFDLSWNAAYPLEQRQFNVTADWSGEAMPLHQTACPFVPAGGTGVCHLYLYWIELETAPRLQIAGRTALSDLEGYRFALTTPTSEVTWTDFTVILRSGLNLATWDTASELSLTGSGVLTQALGAQTLGASVFYVNVTDLAGNGVVDYGDYFTITGDFTPDTQYAVILLYELTGTQMADTSWSEYVATPSLEMTRIALSYPEGYKFILTTPTSEVTWTDFTVILQSGANSATWSTASQPSLTGSGVQTQALGAQTLGATSFFVNVTDLWGNGEISVGDCFTVTGDFAWATQYTVVALHEPTGGQMAEESWGEYVPTPSMQITSRTTLSNPEGYKFSLTTPTSEVTWTDFTVILQSGVNSVVWDTASQSNLTGSGVQTQVLGARMLGDTWFFMNVTDLAGNGVINNGDYFTITGDFTPGTQYIISLVHEPSGGMMVQYTWTA